MPECGPKRIFDFGPKSQNPGNCNPCFLRARILIWVSLESSGRQDFKSVLGFHVKLQKPFSTLQTRRGNRDRNAVSHRPQITKGCWPQGSMGIYGILMTY